MKIDLRTPIVAPGTRVWRLFPGSNYRFLETYFDTNTAFLDFPSLELPEGNLRLSNDLFDRMVASQKTKEQINKKGEDAQVIDWQSERGARRTKTRGRQFQALLNFYQEAKMGDYLIVPSTLSDALVWVGRFVDEQIVSVKHARYFGHRIPARRIKWLAKVAENKLSRPLTQSLRGQHPFSLIERDRFLEVFSAANQSFVYGEHHVGTIYNTKDDFLDSDSALLGIISKLAAAACHSIEEGKAGIGDNLLSALVSTVPINYTCSQESDIHSEGFTRFISAAKTPLIIGTVLIFLLSLPGDISSQQYKEAVNNIQVENSLAPNDITCGPPVSEATKRILNAIDFDTAKKLCEAARLAEERAGLSPFATIGVP